jgi:hypothetical protein
MAQFTKSLRISHHVVLYAGPSLFILYTVLSQSIRFVIGHANYMAYHFWVLVIWFSSSYAYIPCIIM